MESLLLCHWGARTLARFCERSSGLLYIDPLWKHWEGWDQYEWERQEYEVVAPNYWILAGLYMHRNRQMFSAFPIIRFVSRFRPEEQSVMQSILKEYYEFPWILESGGVTHTDFGFERSGRINFSGQYSRQSPER